MAGLIRRRPGRGVIGARPDRWPVRAGARGRAAGPSGAVSPRKTPAAGRIGHRAVRLIRRPNRQPGSRASSLGATKSWLSSRSASGTAPSPRATASCPDAVGRRRASSRASGRRRAVRRLAASRLRGAVSHPRTLSRRLAPGGRGVVSLRRTLSRRLAPGGRGAVSRRRTSGRRPAVRRRAASRFRGAISHRHTLIRRAPSHPLASGPPCAASSPCTSSRRHAVSRRLASAARRRAASRHSGSIRRRLAGCPMAPADLTCAEVPGHAAESVPARALARPWPLTRRPARGRPCARPPRPAWPPAVAPVALPSRPTWVRGRSPPLISVLSPGSPNLGR